MWFPKKSAVDRGIMVNHKNAVKNNFFLYFSQLLNTILDQFVDCKLCIVMYYKFTDPQIGQNYI